MATRPASHHTLYQVSTASALVQGIYQGAVRVGTLREHGDRGLGTFENLDGEMIIVDGRFFPAWSDACVRECNDGVHDTGRCGGSWSRRAPPQRMTR